MHPALEQIRSRWLAEETTMASLRPGTTPEALAAFELRYGVVLPATMRELYSLADGMDGEAEDGLLIYLYPLSSIVRGVAEWQTEVPSWAENWFQFASFLINSHCYLVRLTAEPSNPGPVALFAGGSPRNLVATSFEEFLGIYTNDGQIHDSFGPRGLFGGPEDMPDDAP